MSTAIREQDRDQGRSPVWLACLLAVVFLAWGEFLFHAVGTRPTPTWNFGAIPDVPGLSVYATDTPRPLSGVPYYLHDNADLSPQHVNERPTIAVPRTQEAAP